MELYLRKLSPNVYSRKHGVKIPAYEAYMDVMAILNKKVPENVENREKVQKLVDEYREKVLGKTCLKGAPPEYWEIGLVIDIGIPLPEWRTYSLDYRAQIMARQYLKNMVDTIDAHYKEQDEIAEKNRKDLEAKNKR